MAQRQHCHCGKWRCVLELHQVLGSLSILFPVFFPVIYMQLHLFFSTSLHLRRIIFNFSKQDQWLIGSCHGFKNDYVSWHDFMEHLLPQFRYFFPKKNYVSLVLLICSSIVNERNRCRLYCSFLFVSWKPCFLKTLINSCTSYEYINESSVCALFIAQNRKEQKKTVNQTALA